jgi:c-di-GMP-binding flagellar brake protein YcgR
MCPLEATSANNVQIQLWEKMELEFGKNKNTGICFARAEDLSDGEIMITRPTWLSGEPSFDPSQNFTVTIFREDGTYRFAGTIIRSFKKKNKTYYAIRYPDKLYRHQRRGYVRVDIDAVVYFRILNDILLGKIPYEESKEYIASSINLSGSGILINSLKVLNSDDFVALLIRDRSLNLDFPIFGIVRRIIDADNSRLNAGIEFLTAEVLEKQINSKQLNNLPHTIFNFTERRRQVLVQFIFNYQIKLRQKGLI